MLENATTARSLRLLPLEEARSRLGAAAEAVGAESLVLGSSREGRPIELVRFGSGEQRVLWYAGPHANEPIGVTTIVELAERLVARPDLLAGPIGWDLVLNVDPDGHVRNEAWMDTPSDNQSYFRHFFRPPIAWTTVVFWNCSGSKERSSSSIASLCCLKL